VVLEMGEVVLLHLRWALILLVGGLLSVLGNSCLLTRMVPPTLSPFTLLQISITAPFLLLFRLLPILLNLTTLRPRRRRRCNRSLRAGLPHGLYPIEELITLQLVLLEGIGKSEVDGDLLRAALQVLELDRLIGHKDKEKVGRYVGCEEAVPDVVDEDREDQVEVLFEDGSIVLVVVLEAKFTLLRLSELLQLL